MHGQLTFCPLNDSQKMSAWAPPQRNRPPQSFDTQTELLPSACDTQP